MKRHLLWRLVLLLAVVVFLLMYSVIHETGHILALKAFGAWGHGGALLLPLPGQVPHVSGDPSAHLQGWQIAVTAMLGPLLPTLFGYLSFAFWVSPFGRRRRSQSQRVELIWSLFMIMMLLPQAVPAPMLFPSVVHDRDYSLLVQNVGQSPWLANAAVAMVAVVNAALVAWVGRNFILRLRSIANQQRRGNGNQNMSSDPNRTPQTGS